MSKNLIAIHEVIHDGKDGKREVVAPGKPFVEYDDTVAEKLLALGAAKLGSGKAPAAAPAADNADDGGNDDGQGNDGPNLDDMTVAQLKQFASDNNIELDEKLKKKDEIRAAIDAALKEDEII